VGVRLHQRRRDSEPRGRVHHRAGDVAASAQDDVRLPLAQDPLARAWGSHRTAERSELGRPRLPWQPGDPKGVELESRLRNEPRLGAIRRPGEGHGHFARDERLRDGERRQHVTGRPPGCDQALELSLLRHVLRC
jgi:hypothetical protein